MSGGINYTGVSQTIGGDPQRDAYNLGLLELAKDRASTPTSIPPQRVAPMNATQNLSLGLARSGIGDYQPWMNDANKYMDMASVGYRTADDYARNAANNANNIAGQYGSNGIAAGAQYGNQAQNYAFNQAGIGTLAGFNGAQGYNPNSAAAFMDPYQAMVTQRALGEMDRQATGLRQNNAASAVRSGAYGGARHGVVEAETERNLEDLKSNRIFEDYSRNYQQAQQAAMTAQQQQQLRMQQAGQMAMQGGELGARTAMSNAQLQQQGYLTAGELAARTALEGGRLGSGAMLDSSRGLESLGVNSSKIGGLEQLYGQNDSSFLYNMGAKQQQQAQLALDAQYKNQMAQTYDPYQRISFMSDIYRGVPSSGSTMSTTGTATPSAASQLLGTGIATYGAIGAYNNATRGFGT